MRLFEKIGLARKKPRPVGQKLEKGLESPKKGRHANWVFKVGILFALILITMAAFPRGEVYQYTVQVGDEWRQDDLVAPFDYPLYKTAEELAEEREAVRRRTPPYFAEIPNAMERVAANRDTVAQQLSRVFSAYESYRLAQLRGRSEQAHRDSLLYLERRREARLKATPEQWQMLVNSYAERVPELPQSSREPPVDARLDEVLLSEASEIANQLLAIGVLDVPIDSVHAEQIYIRNEVERNERMGNKANLYGLNEAYEFAQRQFQQLHEDQPQVANIGAAFFRAIFAPSLAYLRSYTISAWQRQEDRISVTRGKVAEGEVIVEKGQRITDQIRERLTSLERARRDAGGDDILWRVLLGQFLITLSTYFIFFLYLYLLRRSIFDDNRKILLLAILFAGIIGLYAVALRVETLAMYIVPMAIAPVLFTVMFDSRVGLFGALTLSLIGGLLLNYDFEFTFATLFASTLGVFSVRDIRNRGQFFFSAGLVFLGYLAVIGATAIYFGTPTERFLSDLLLVAINSFLLILAYPLLWVFERSFDITTDVTLLELSDTNRPLLKELSLRAPGTFNHSLQVANLAEAAADAVGANALLTRVGALYHDIGKMLKPEYFVENQRPGSNPHNQLKPRMSALIIASHVKEGLEMGRQYNLPQRVLDFIPMHHGTTRIEFFYRKAVDQRKEGDPEILESEFRYPGPRPNLKETGILMLADSVEAASRSLSDPTHKRLETLIDMIFRARIEDGQLDKTDLTFRDLTQIRETFLSMLLGIYHVRVKYPGQIEEGRPPDRPRLMPPPETPEFPSEAADTALESGQKMDRIRERGVYGTMEQGVSADSVSDIENMDELESDVEGSSLSMQSTGQENAAVPEEHESAEMRLDQNRNEGREEAGSAQSATGLLDDETLDAAARERERLKSGDGPSEEEIENRARNSVADSQDSVAEAGGESTLKSLSEGPESTHARDEATSREAEEKIADIPGSDRDSDDDTPDAGTGDGAAAQAEIKPDKGR